MSESASAISLKDKVATVTGGNSGIGQAIVLELARLQANIVIYYVAHPEATEALERAICKLGDQSIGVKADVSKIADLKMLVNQAVSQFGRVDIMVNNAGSKPEPRSSTPPRSNTNAYRDQSQQRFLRHANRRQADDQAGRWRPDHQHHLGP